MIKGLGFKMIEGLGFKMIKGLGFKMIVSGSDRGWPNEVAIIYGGFECGEDRVLTMKPPS